MFCVRFQYMPRGSLFDLLHGAAGVVVDTAQAVRFALDIARGMAFLHSLERIIPEYYLNSLHVMVSARIRLCNLIHFDNSTFNLSHRLTKI